jgi:hypothetical protein
MKLLITQFSPVSFWLLGPDILFIAHFRYENRIQYTNVSALLLPNKEYRLIYLMSALKSLCKNTLMHIEISGNYVIEPVKFCLGLRQGWELISPILHNTQNATYL